LKTTEQTPTSVSQIQRKSASSFFGNTTEQSPPFFAGKETVNTGGFFSPAAPLSKNSPIQAKLTVGAPNDKYEQEADTMADKVVQRLSQSETIQTKATPSVSAPIVRGTAAEEDKLQKKEEEKQPEETPELQKSPVSAVGDDEGLQMKCDDCEKEDKNHVQRKESGETSASPSIESRLSATKGGGSPLANDTRSGMESAFGADFSGVRVHTGGEAVQMSQDLNAHAFTHGSDVYFNSGKYNPSNTEGSKLLAHELTHTVQQNSSHSGGLIQRGEAGVHHGIEREAAGVNMSPTPRAVEEMYAGNWMRDFSQVNVPLVHNFLARIPSRIDGSNNDVIGQQGARDISIGLVRALAMLEFGPEITNSVITAANLGVYEPEHHIDNPQGTSAEDHLITGESGNRIAEEQMSGGSVQNNGWHSVHPEINEQLGGSAIPGLQMENQAVYQVSASGLTNHIYNSIEWAKNNMVQALVAGHTPNGRMHLGTALHVVEDYFSHSNFIEVCLNSEIRRAINIQQSGSSSTLPPSFIRLVQNQQSPQEGAFVDTLYDAKTPQGRQAVTTGTFGSEDTKVSIAHLVLPQLPKLVDIVNTKLDEVLNFTMSEKKKSWSDIEKSFKGERKGLAFMEIVNALDSHIQAPVYGIEFTNASLSGFTYPNGFTTTTQYVGVKEAYNHYSNVYQTIKSVERDIKSALVFPLITDAINALFKTLDELIKQKIAELRQLLKVTFNQFILGLIESITGIDIPNEKKKTIADAADFAQHQVESMEHGTSLESRIAGGEIDTFRQGRAERGRGDEAGDINQEIANVYGTDSTGVPIRPLPPSHSELSKDHPPHQDRLDSHDVRVELVQTRNVEINGRRYTEQSVTPRIVPDEAHELSDGSVFYQLHRQFALEADRQIIAAISEIWTRDNANQVLVPSELNATPTLDRQNIRNQASSQQSIEQQRATQSGRQFGVGANVGIEGAPQLLSLVDLFISHPDDNAWWTTILQNYVAQHEAEVIAHIRARNQTRHHRTYPPPPTR
jgi:Domain of unknown function (DUF4157)/Heterokaryon incompatibility protein Het-C